MWWYWWSNNDSVEWAQDDQRVWFLWTVNIVVVVEDVVRINGDLELVDQYSWIDRSVELGPIQIVVKISRVR